MRDSVCQQKLFKKLFKKLLKKLFKNVFNKQVYLSAFDMVWFICSEEVVAVWLEPSNVIKALQ